MLQDRLLFRGGGSRHLILADDDQRLVAPAASVRMRSSLSTLARRLWRIAVAIRGRLVLTRLAELDDRLLADIGITRGDLSNAFREPLLRDPTNLLARQAREQRLRSQRAARHARDEKPSGHASKSTGEVSHVPVKPIYFVGC